MGVGVAGLGAGMPHLTTSIGMGTLLAGFGAYMLLQARMVTAMSVTMSIGFRAVATTGRRFRFASAATGFRCIRGHLRCGGFGILGCLRFTSAAASFRLLSLRTFLHLFGFDRFGVVGCGGLGAKDTHESETGEQCKDLLHG